MSHDLSSLFKESVGEDEDFFASFSAGSKGPFDTEVTTSPPLPSLSQHLPSPTSSEFPPQHVASLAPLNANVSDLPTPFQAPSLTRPSLIAARRSQKQEDTALIQPEQDVIYKAHQPHMSVHLPPPPMDIPSPVAPLVRARDVVAPPTNEKKADQGGLRVFCSFGFGGRLIVGGGRFGPRLAMPTIRSVFFNTESTKQLMNDIEAFPSALGSVSGLVTEQVVSYCRSLCARRKKTDRFGSASLPDAHLMWAFLASLLQGRKAAVANSRLAFLSALWEESVEEMAIVDTNSLLFRFVKNIIAGNMSASIALTAENPNLHPLAMAVASIHSAEYFRESVLAYSSSLGGYSADKTAPLARSDSEKTLLECIRLCVTAFASTASIDAIMSDSVADFACSHWKILAALFGSLIKPSSTSSAGGGVSFLVRLGQILSFSKKNVCASHLCMLLSGKARSLDPVDAHDSIISLLGADHRDIAHFHRLLDIAPIQMSEVFEYASRVTMAEETPFFVALQPWKFAYASLLCDLGMFELAEKYLRVINAFAKAVPTNKYTVHFRSGLRELENRISLAKEVPAEKPSNGSTLDAIWGGFRARIL